MATVQPQQADEIYYPCEDGEPMAESDIHIDAIILLRECLRDVFRDTDVYVPVDMFWYWEEGNVKARRAPDAMVIPGVGQHKRRSFLSWRENGAIPAVIFEISSDTTWREDLYEKRRLYASLGVKEYFLFDPEAQYLRPQLQGFRLENGQYIPLESDAEDRLFSEETGLYLRAEGEMIRLFDGETGEPILTREEQTEKARNQAEQAQSEMEREQQRSKALETEIAKLREQLRSQSNLDDDEKQ